MKEDHDENEDESEYDGHAWLSLINAHESGSLSIK